MISVIIPCRNEAKHIAECVHAIYGSKLENEELEVIVVDGMSNDGTIEEIGKLAEQYPGLRLVPNPQQVTPVAFNTGIRAAHGTYVQIVGARQIISETYLEGAKKILEQDTETWCVGGAVENVYQDTPSEIIGLAMASPFGVGGGNFRILKKSGFVDTVGTPMYRKSVFDQVGMFNETLVRNQDDELNYRITKAGGKIFLNADIRIKYYVRANVKNLFRQYFQYGYWKVYVNRLHNTVTSLRQLVPFFFVSGLILGFILSFLIPYFIFIYLAGIFLYCGAALAFGFESGGATKGIRVAAIFPVLHLAYGWGYLRGLFEFMLLGRQPASTASKLSR
jgi:glycosyltransferase involved in cell wall biosynthesis